MSFVLHIVIEAPREPRDAGVNFSRRLSRQQPHAANSLRHRPSSISGRFLDAAERFSIEPIEMSGDDSSLHRKSWLREVIHAVIIAHSLRGRRGAAMMTSRGRTDYRQATSVWNCPASSLSQHAVVSHRRPRNDFGTTFVRARLSFDTPWRARIGRLLFLRGCAPASL